MIQRILITILTYNTIKRNNRIKIRQKNTTKFSKKKKKRNSFEEFYNRIKLRENFTFL